MAELKKRHNFAIQGPTEKKRYVLAGFFCTDATYKILSSLLKRFSSFTTNERHNRNMEGRTDRQREFTKKLIRSSEY